MTAQELLKSSADNMAYQLKVVFDGLTGDQWDHQVTPQASSPREIVRHVAEAYHALAHLCSGNGHYEAWGSFQLEAGPGEAQVEEMMAHRAQAMALALESEGSELLKGAMDYVALHDSYHIGQMVLVRMHLDPEFNAYALYGG